MKSPVTTRPGLELTDLLQELDSVWRLLDDRLQQADWLDAYLLCAGAAQVLQDALAGRNAPGGRAWWRRVARQFERGSWSRPAGVAVNVVLDTADRVLELMPSARRVIRAAGHVLRLAEALAAACLTPHPLNDHDQATLQALWKTARNQATTLPRVVGSQLLRMPSSFRSLDQHPADIEALVVRFAQCWRARDVSVLVVGVRTSGSYLAPLAAAALRGQGYRRVEAITVRPHTTPAVRERRLLERARAAGGLVVVLDDPPVSGRSVRAVADDLERRGVAADRIVLLLALTQAAETPAALRRYQTVVLQWPEWHVHRLLEPEAVADALREMLPPGTIVAGARRWPDPRCASRNHVLAHYTIELADDATGVARRLEVAVEGSGLGFFGRHALPVASALQGMVPTVYDFRDGLTYRQWVGEPVRQERMAEPAVCAGIGAYVARRHGALPAEHDRSRRLAGEQPVWEVASSIVASALGRPGSALRPLLVDPLVRSLLSTQRPSVVDGRMQPNHWFQPTDGRLVKIETAAGAFSRLDLSCYDPVSDLAAAAVEVADGPGATRAEEALRQQFERDSGIVVDEERWLLYQLVHIWNAERIGRWMPHEAERARARALQRYLAAVYLCGLPVQPEGPLCAIDIDGVLESSPLGCSATTNTGAIALRSLKAHQYRVVLVTGRSLDELVDRCQTYQLAGGVAEYGTVVYDHDANEAVPLLSPSEILAVERLRACLRARETVDVDPGYRHVARVRRRATDLPTRKRSVPPNELGALPGPPCGAWQFVVGDGQTDIVGPGIDKGRSLRVLAARLSDGRGPTPIALAVGDTESDLPMLRLAERAYAPANATQGVRTSGVSIVRGAYQRGLAEAVGQLIGHPPGQCSTCRPLAMGAGRTRLLQLLSAQEAGPLGVPGRVVRLAAGGVTKQLWG